MKVLIAVFALMVAASAQNAVHLKNRTILPERTARPLELRGQGSHYLVQFKSYPGPDVRSELARRRVRVLGYIPDFSMLVTSEAPVSLRGLDVTWVGRLESGDKISPSLEAGAAGIYLIIFHADISEEAQREVLAANRFEILPNPYLLSGQWLIFGDPAALPKLAEADEVAYLMPASLNLFAAPVMGCRGPLTEAGPIAEYVQVGAGWPKDSSGKLALQYSFQSITTKIDESIVKGEIERAFREWQRYGNFTLSAGAKADAVRTIAIQFARGMHGDVYPFDGPHGVLAHTFYPSPVNSEPIAGDMHLDADEDWHAGSDTDLFSVVLHETGHAVGLGHSSVPGAVMYPYYRFSSGLTDDDIAGIRNLYSAAGIPPITPPVAPPVIPVTPPAKPPLSDTTPPALRITSPATTIVSTTSSFFHVAGTSSDNVAVSVVKWSTSNGDTGVASGITAWSADIPILIGTTAVTIRAYDAAGNSGWRSITITRH
jgi:hypothetical protein